MQMVIVRLADFKLTCACHIVAANNIHRHGTLSNTTQTAARACHWNYFDILFHLVSLLSRIRSWHNYEPFTFWEYQQAYDTSRLSDEKREKKIAQGAIDFDVIEKGAQETPVEYFVDLKNGIENALTEFLQLSASLDKATNQSQPTSYIKQALEQCLNAVLHLGADKLSALEQQVLEEQQDIAEEDESQESSSASTSKSDNGAITSREGAIKKLQEIALYFRKTEPHSPMSYTIEQVIRWSELSLPELLNELITDSDARTGYFKLSGIKVSETETE